MATRKVTAAPSGFKAGQRVQMIAPPHRKGIVAAVTGSGASALITVNFPGWHPVSFRPAQLALL